MRSRRHPPAPAPRQLALPIERSRLLDLTPTERDEVMSLLAALLLQASGVAEREGDDERA
ncbi:MAG TPA: hypothetical protein VFG43_01995 [Geminicoccaceae bacterium]|jgi:hypothetical protein|nr:hypothetical protein [Geminicoccaceae bacterium]